MDGIPPGQTWPLILGIIASAISGYAAIWGLLAYVRRHNYDVFVIYRLVLAAAIVIVIVSGARGADVLGGLLGPAVVNGGHRGGRFGGVSGQRSCLGGAMRPLGRIACRSGSTHPPRCPLFRTATAAQKPTGLASQPVEWLRCRGWPPLRNRSPSIPGSGLRTTCG